MSSSSLPTDFSITLNDTASCDTISITSGDITLDNYTYTPNTMNTITLTGGGTSINTYSINDTVTIDNSAFTWSLPEEWVNAFPDWDRIKDMCEKYPGLEIAFRNFKNTYQLVKDDYDNPKDEK